MINMNCFLLGAGASYGYADRGNSSSRNNAPPEICLPPTTKYLIATGVETGILNQRDYPALYGILQRLIGTSNNLRNTNRDNLIFDIEYFFSWILSGNFKDSREFGYIMGEAFYFLYELMRLPQILHAPHIFEDNYTLLAKSYHKEPYSVVTLNYDTLFENALLHNELQPYYGLDYPNQISGVPYAKIHGSVNWLYPLLGMEGIQGIYQGISQNNIKLNFLDI